MTWQKLPNTAMAVITDLDDTVSVHPPNKQPVGERLSLPARALVYHQKIEYAGPVYQSMEIAGNTIVLSFTHTGSGLAAKGGELKDFTIAGDDKKFVAAKATIKGNKVIVYSPLVTHPVAVRLGWRFCPQDRPRGETRPPGRRRSGCLPCPGIWPAAPRSWTPLFRRRPISRRKV